MRKPFKRTSQRAWMAIGIAAGVGLWIAALLLSGKVLAWWESITRLPNNF